jgi:hypothetical protein
MTAFNHRDKRVLKREHGVCLFRKTSVDSKKLCASVVKEMRSLDYARDDSISLGVLGVLVVQSIGFRLLQECASCATMDDTDKPCHDGIIIQGAILA